MSFPAPHSPVWALLSELPLGVSAANTTCFQTAAGELCCMAAEPPQHSLKLGSSNESSSSSLFGRMFGSGVRL